MRSIVEIQADLNFYTASKVNWQNAFNAIAQGGQRYSFRDGDASRELTRADLPEIIKTIQWVEGKINALRKELEDAQGSPNGGHSSGRVRFACGG